VGGHYRAGESLAETLRETNEEIGVAVTLSELSSLGVRVCANEAEPGILDRELQNVFLFQSDRSLVAYRPDPAELAALIRLRIQDVLALFAGDADLIRGDSLAPGSTAVESVAIGRDDFIPNVDRYFYRVAIAARLVLRGETHVAV
jgi:hypothetical protein